MAASTIDHYFFMDKKGDSTTPTYTPTTFEVNGEEITVGADKWKHINNTWTPVSENPSLKWVGENNTTTGQLIKYIWVGSNNPDKTKIYFNSNKPLYVLNKDNTELVQYTTGGRRRNRKTRRSRRKSNRRRRSQKARI